MKRQLACTMLALCYTPDFRNQMATSRRHGTQASSWGPGVWIRARYWLWDHLHGGSPKDELEGPMGPH